MAVEERSSSDAELVFEDENNDREAGPSSIRLIRPNDVEPRSL